MLHRTAYFYFVTDSGAATTISRVVKRHLRFLDRLAQAEIPHDHVRGPFASRQEAEDDRRLAIAEAQS